MAHVGACAAQIATLITLCVGDGAAEAVGTWVAPRVRGTALRVLGMPVLPGQVPRKTLAGTLAFVAASVAGMAGMFWAAESLGWFLPQALIWTPHLWAAIVSSAAIAGVAEAYTFGAVDNLTVPAVVWVTWYLQEAPVLRLRGVW